MTRALALLAGAAIAGFGVALENATSALFWPQAARGLQLLCLAAGGVAAFGIGLAPAAWLERARRHQVVLLALAAVAALATVPASAAAARATPPGSGLFSLPLPFLLLAAAPFVAAGVVFTAGAGRGTGRRTGWVAIGAGIGCLTLAAASGLQARSPWLGGHLLAFTDSGAGAFTLAVDRGLREDLVAPADALPLFLKLHPDDGQPLECLVVGFPNGAALAALLREPRARVTILAEDRRIVAETLRRWPELESARAEGRVSFTWGAPRWSLERSATRYDVIVLSPDWSPAAHLARALNFRSDYTWTVEAFRSYLAHLTPGGYLIARRTGAGRVVTTLREAAGLPVADFADRLVVASFWGRLDTLCLYSAQSLNTSRFRDELYRVVLETGVNVRYRPRRRETNFYMPLVYGDRPRGLAFSTPQDLSPPIDARPFFDHLERLTISPSGPSLPEEIELEIPVEPFQVIPSGDRPVWWLLLAGVSAAAVLTAVAAGALRRHEGGPGSIAALPVAAFLGAAAALASEAFGAWSLWLSPSAGFAQAATAAVPLCAGLGWLLPQRQSGTWPALVPLAAVLALFAVAGGYAAPLIPRAGAGFSGVVVAAAGCLLGAALGRGLRAAARHVPAGLPGAGPSFAGAALCAAALAGIAATLAATHFGHPLLWALAAIAVLAAARRLRFLPCGPPT